ncbi:MAG: hypothetical protein ACYCYF_09820 [Anaerolineae bacterium]
MCALHEGVFASEWRAVFCAGYRRSAQLTETERLRVDLYSVYLILLLIVEGFYRGYRRPDQEKHLQGSLASLTAGLRRGGQL